MLAYATRRISEHLIGLGGDPLTARWCTATVRAREDVLARVGVAQQVDHLALSLHRAGKKKNSVAEGEFDTIIWQFNDLPRVNKQKTQAPSTRRSGL